MNQMRKEHAAELKAVRAELQASQQAAREWESKCATAKQQGADFEAVLRAELAAPRGHPHRGRKVRPRARAVPPRDPVQQELRARLDGDDAAAALASKGPRAPPSKKSSRSRAGARHATRIRGTFRSRASSHEIASSSQ